MDASSGQIPSNTETDTSQANAAKPVRAAGVQPLDYAFQALLLPLRKSLARIEARLKASAASEHVSKAATKEQGSGRNDLAAARVDPTDKMAVTDNGLLGALEHRFDRLSTELTNFRDEVLAFMKTSAIAVGPVTPTGTAPAGKGSSRVAAASGVTNSTIVETLDDIILGRELNGDPALNAVRRQFLAELVAGNVSARALAGQLLLLQATAADELPERFRHVGEAYYLWRPRLTTTDDPFERALADWLTRRAEAAGLRNSIQLVRPGDRFDSARHLAATRGVEVVAVHGWIVLRDNQKVYTKASVTVQ